MSKELIRPSQFAHVEASLAETEKDLLMSDEQRKELEQLYSGVLENIAPGKLMEATVLEVDGGGVLVDIGFKSNGLIPRFEFSDHEFKKLAPGTKIEIIVDQLENPDGSVALSYEKAKAIRAWDAITKLFEEGKPVEGTVTHKVKGGLNVDIGIPAFLPGSQIDLQRVTDFDHFVGQTVSAQIIKLNQKRGNVIISRRKFLAEERGQARKQILDTLKEAQVLKGIVKNITNYGAFVDIGGVDGLLHITDMTWGRISHPSELLKIGQELTVKILSFDKDNEKISLGMKQLTDNPWEKAAKTIKTGDTITGTISTITDYGLFIGVAPDVEGLVHISEVSWTDRINDLKDKFKVGDSIEVRVVSFDPENRRMSLSVKQLSENPWERVDKEFKEGQKVTGNVSNITDFGVFVQLLPGIDGLVHISDISWTDHIEHPSDKYKLGDEVEAVVLGVDKDNKKVSLGIKQLTEDPWQSIEKIHPIGSTIEGTVSKITNFGAFIKLPSGVEGLIHKSEVSDDSVSNVEDVLKVGQALEFKVVNLNKEDRKLGLSLRSDEKIKEAKQQRSPKHGQSQQRQSQQSSQQYVRVEPQPRAKNTLQMELERYAARKDDETSDDKE